MIKDLGFEPTANRIFVIADPREDATESGIILIHVKANEYKGTVATLGLRFNGSKLSIEAGDRVTWSAGRGVDIEINKVNYVMLEESEILWYTKKN
jgi:co-chaperonin GroES (HSP10)